VTFGNNLGVVGSFIKLLQSVDADIVMFSDQDDVWLPTKVSKAVSALVDAGLHRPLLYHTDLVVVNESLQTVTASFMAQQGLQMPRAHSLQVLAIQNCVVGCTVAMTASLVRSAALSDRVASVAAMHDWWLAMFASCRGGLIYSANAEILYRQHNANVSGAKRRSLLEQIRKQFSAIGISRINSYRTKISRQSREFLRYYRPVLNPVQQEILSKAAALDPSMGFVPVLKSQIFGIRFQNFYMNLSLVFTAIYTQMASRFSRVSRMP
jgi:rhamnosyltransferase